MKQLPSPPATYKEATYRTVHRSPGFSPEQIAEHLNIKPSTLYSMANRNMPEVDLPRKHLEPIVALTGNTAFAEYVAAISGGVFVSLPGETVHVGDVVKAAAQAMDESAHVFSAVAEALADNGHVDRGRELERIEMHARHVQAAMGRVVMVARREAAEVER